MKKYIIGTKRHFIGSKSDSCNLVSQNSDVSDMKCEKHRISQEIQREDLKGLR